MLAAHAVYRTGVSVSGTTQLAHRPAALSSAKIIAGARSPNAVSVVIVAFINSICEPSASPESPKHNNIEIACAICASDAPAAGSPVKAVRGAVTHRALVVRHDPAVDFSMRTISEVDLYVVGVIFYELIVLADSCDQRCSDLQMQGRINFAVEQ